MYYTSVLYVCFILPKLTFLILAFFQQGKYFFTRTNCADMLQFIGLVKRV
jgi:hypothetical protein